MGSPTRQILWAATAATLLAACARSTDDWVEDLRSDDEYRRLLAATALGLEASPRDPVDVVAGLLNILEDPDDQVADAARASLGALAPRVPGAFAEVMSRTEVVHHPGAPPPTFIRNSAAHFLVEASAVEALVGCLGDATAVDRGLAATSLGRIGGDAIRPLIDLMNSSDDPHVRNLAAIGLGKALATDPGAARSELPGLDGGTPSDVTIEALRAAGGFGVPTEVTTGWVVAQLMRWRSSEPSESIGAEIELRLAPAARLIDELIALVDHDKPPVAAAAAFFLTRMGNDAILRAFPRLDPDRVTHRELLKHLATGLHDVEAAISTLCEIAGGGVRKASRRAVLVLGGMGPRAERAMPILRRISATATGQRKAEADEAMRRITAES